MTKTQNSHKPKRKRETRIPDVMRDDDDDQQGRRGRSRPQQDKARAIVRPMIIAGETISPHKLQEQHGISHVTFDMAIAAELARKEAFDELNKEQTPEPAPDPLPPPPPRNESLSDKFLTPEQVDPDFKGTPLEFTTKYGHVLLYTKPQIEERKREDVLLEWTGKAAAFDVAARAMLKALAVVDPMTLQAWARKPIKGQKLLEWCKIAQAACDALAAARPVGDDGT
jgi:hypothetical protein